VPVTTKKIKGKDRVVEAATGKIAKTANGKAKDGGGGKNAKTQARAINAGLRKAGKI